MCGSMEDIHMLERSFVKMFEGADKLIIVYKEHELSIEQRITLAQQLEKEREEEAYKAALGY